MNRARATDVGAQTSIPRPALLLHLISCHLRPTRLLRQAPSHSLPLLPSSSMQLKACQPPNLPGEHGSTRPGQSARGTSTTSSCECGGMHALVSWFSAKCFSRRDPENSRTMCCQFRQRRVQLMQQRRSSKQGRDVLSPPSSSSTSLGYARGYTSPAAGQRQDALGYSGIAVGIQSSLAQSEEEYVSLLRDEGATGARLSCSGALSNVRRSLQSQVREMLPLASLHSDPPPPRLFQNVKRGIILCLCTNLLGKADAAWQGR
jgi:hypothetical protein